jgi:hypothetical protein
MVEYRFDLQYNNGSRNHHVRDWNNGSASCAATTEGSSHELVCFPVAVSLNYRPNGQY